MHVIGKARKVSLWEYFNIFSMCIIADCKIQHRPTSKWISVSTYKFPGVALINNAEYLLTEETELLL